jgi:hypothetical protein
MKIRPVGAELFNADRRTGMAKLIVAFRNFANAPKNNYERWSWQYRWCATVRMRESSDPLSALFLAVTSLEAQLFICHVSQNASIFCCISSLSVPWWLFVSRLEVRSSLPYYEIASTAVRVFALLPMHLGTSATSKFTMILEFPTFLTISDF